MLNSVNQIGRSGISVRFSIWSHAACGRVDMQAKSSVVLSFWVSALLQLRWCDPCGMAVERSLHVVAFEQAVQAVVGVLVNGQRVDRVVEDRDDMIVPGLPTLGS